jgi:hypothetical protein
MRAPQGHSAIRVTMPYGAAWPLSRDLTLIFIEMSGLPIVLGTARVRRTSSNCPEIDTFQRASAVNTTSVAVLNLSWGKGLRILIARRGSLRSHETA